MNMLAAQFNTTYQQLIFLYEPQTLTVINMTFCPSLRLAATLCSVFEHRPRVAHYPTRTYGLEMCVSSTKVT